jgi:hypothetical protein
MGPGTQVITNLINGVKPVNYTDALAIRHDLEYLRGNFNLADLQAIKDSFKSFDFGQIPMRSGLALRLFSGFEPSNPYGNIDLQELYSIGTQLANKVIKDAGYNV